jgi:hypothetical protein
MKRRIGCCILALALLASASVTAVPGTATDPVITKLYIEEEFFPSIKAKAQSAASGSLDFASAQVQLLINTRGQEFNQAALARRVMGRLRFTGNGSVTLKAGSVLTLGRGTNIQPVSGTMRLGDGTLVNLTAGRDVNTGSTVPRYNRCAALHTGVTVNVITDVTVHIHGSFRVEPPYAVMYKDLCDALMAMGIINTYQLERNTTRLEMFIIFVTLLGVKDEASSYNGTHPFTDITWGNEYVAWLYRNGHTAGTGGNRFSPDQPGSIQQMCFIMLRALGYRDGVETTYNTAVRDAVRYGLFSQREIDILSRDGFTRDAMMYMTYYSLFATYRNSDQTVLGRLTANGQVDKAASDKAIADVRRIRF